MFSMRKESTRKPKKRPISTIQIRKGDLSVSDLYAEAKAYGFPSLSSYLRHLITAARDLGMAALVKKGEAEVSKKKRQTKAMGRVNG